MSQPLLPSEIARAQSNRSSRSASWANVREIDSVRDMDRLTGPITFLEQGNENIYFRDGDDQTWFFKAVGRDQELMQILKFMDNPPRLRAARYHSGPMTAPEKKQFFKENPEFEEMNVNPPESVIRVREEMQGKTAYVDPQSAPEVKHLLSHILAALRAQYMMYQTLHWQAKGAAYYGNHLLFQRLYESVQGEIDQAAEKLVGYTGGDSVHLPAQLSLIQIYCSRWCSVENPFERGLQAEQDLQKLLKFAYDKMKATQSLTLGLDDWIMATASAHETNQYLLQQVQA